MNKDSEINEPSIEEIKRVKKSYLPILIISIVLLFFFSFYGIVKYIQIKKARHHLNTGVSYIEGKRFELAKKEFEDAIKYNPKLWQAYYNLGKMENNNKNWDTAISYLSQCTSINPQYSDAYMLLSRCLYFKKDYFLGHTVISNYISQKPKDPEGYYAQGLINIKQKQWDLALKNLKHASALDSTNENYLDELARLHIKTNQYIVASEIWLNLYNLSSTSNTTYLNNGILSLVYQFGDYKNHDTLKKVMKLADLSIEKDPDNPDIYFNLGLAYRENKQYQKALIQYKKGFSLLTTRKLSKQITSYDYVDFGVVLNEMGKRKEAINQLKCALIIMPENEEALAYLGHLYYLQKDYDKAYELFQKCLKIAPDYNTIHHDLAIFYYYVKKDYDKYQEHWDLYCQMSSHTFVPYH